ncbi:MAG: hypothetical protein AT718_07410 [Vulcanisaeta sp. JCHS_4]|jgi:hypothetical protein|nr:MAG: hypothetical protein AT718_07410 [Vulcanisaeta sp. JCHS_4]
MAEKKRDEEEIKQVAQDICQKVNREDEAYTVRDFIFKLMNLHRIDNELYMNELGEFIYFLKKLNIPDKDIEVISEKGQKDWPWFRLFLIRTLTCLKFEEKSESESKVENQGNKVQSLEVAAHEQ